MEGHGIVGRPGHPPDEGAVGVSPRRSHNQDLADLPSFEAILEAMRKLEDQHRYTYGSSAQAIAYAAGVRGARRLGRGAMGPQSWTGYMAPALRIAPRLRAMERAGLVRSFHGDGHDRYRKLWVRA
jgi:hypothetical protein